MRWDRIANAKANLSVDVGLLLRYHLSFVAMRFSPPEFPSFLSLVFFVERERHQEIEKESNYQGTSSRQIMPAWTLSRRPFCRVPLKQILQTVV